MLVMPHRTFCIFAVSLLFCWGAASISAQADFGFSPLDELGGDADATADHARAQLVADVESIAPGEPFRLGVLFEMDPHWHIYWRNSGDVGLPTEIEWQLPEGFTAGPLHWPAPDRIEQGGLISYGYHGQTLLFAEIRPPEELDAGAGPLAFKARADWLVCKETCIPGGAAVELTRTVGAGEPSEDSELFDRYAERVPQPREVELQSRQLDIAFEPAGSLDPLEPGESRSLTVIARPGADYRLIFDEAAAAPGLFPAPPDEFEVTHPSLTTQSHDRIAFELPLQPRPQAEDATYNYELVLTARVEDQQSGEVQTLDILISLPLKVGGAARGEAVAEEGEAIPQTAEAGVMAEPAEAPVATGKETGEAFSFIEPRAREGNLGYFLLLAFLGGLILNIFPCVLPVISLKVMSFVRQAGEDRGRILSLGLMFAAGVLVSFALLGGAVIALQAFGQQVGWGFQMQDPRFVIFITAVVFAFGLSLFGVFSVSLPGTATTSMDEAARKEGYGGAFLNGALAVALATACTAPFLSPAMGFALTQPPFVILLFFLTVGIGLAFPYVMLAANPVWLKWMPKPGAWMETFKQAMGFPLMATVVWLMYVLGSLMGAEGIVWTMAFLLCLGLACWLYGHYSDPRATRTQRRAGWSAALILIVAGYVVFPERHLQHMAGAPQTTPVDQELTMESTRGGITWQPFSVARIEQLVAENRTVFVDFTADWCITCKVNEQGALSSREVAAAFERHDVVPIKADWTQRGETIARVLEQFGRSGVPLYVIFPAGRAEEPMVLPTLLTPGLVVEKIEEATGGRSALAAR